MLLREAYEVTYKILPADSQHPFDLCMQRKQETVETYGPLRRLISEYKLNKVNTHFDLNLVEFLELPRNIINDILELCREEARVDAATLSGIEKEIANNKNA